MRKLAYLAIFLLIGLVILVTLGITNYAGIGDAIGGFMRSSVIAPIRNFFVNGWLFIGTSGWYIAAAIVGIGMFWIPFYYIVLKGLFWNNLVQQKLLHKTATSKPLYQSTPSATIPITTSLQSAPRQTAPQAAPQTTPQEQKEKTS